MTETSVSLKGSTPDRVWQPGEFVYLDPVSGKGISTHSMMKTFRRCPKQFEYKYIQRLKPKVMGRPLRFGTWMHALLEAYYKQEDVEAVHTKFTLQFSKYFDEEKEALGDLPRDVWRTFNSYLWHYKADPWKVHEVEFTLEVELPDGSLYRCKLDMLIENQYGLWIVDHKNHKTLPRLDFRLLDAQSALYVWAAMKNKIPVQGHIWNYLISKPPGVPDVLKSGKRLSASKIDTDYPTYLRAIKAAEFDPNDYADKLRYLKSLRYVPGEMQRSTHFRRDILERSPAMLKRVASEAYQTHLRMNAYRWDKVQAVERNVDRSCTFMCSYTDLCTMELFGGNVDQLRRQKYSEGDPMDYYYDERPGQETSE
jgi:PD-(D/E)XK nuclease superfamily